MEIRELTRPLLAGAKAVLKDAFWREEAHPLYNEWEFSEALLRDKDYVRELCLVAVDGETVVGYNALTPATIGNRTGLALGPLGVAKDRQGEGVGTALVRESISRAKAMGYSWIVVLGGDYYLRFDFEPAVPYGVYIQKDCAENAYLKLLFLNETDREGLTGKIIYCETFYDENGRLL